MPDQHYIELSIQMAATPSAPDVELRMKLNPSNDGQLAILHPYRMGQTYEAATTHVIRRALGPGDHMVDGGAHVGHMSLIAAATVGQSGHVTSFEPMPQNAEALRQHALMNNFTQITVVEAALSDAPGQADLHINADMDAGHALWDVGKHFHNEKSRAHPETLTVSLTTLAESLKGLPDPRLIKLDVEGAEVKAIEGAGKIFSAARVPYVITELNLIALDCMNTTEMIMRNTLKNRGYQEWAIADARDGQPARLRPLKDHLMYGASGVFNLLFTTPEMLPALALPIDREAWIP